MHRNVPSSLHSRSHHWKIWVPDLEVRKHSMLQYATVCYSMLQYAGRRENTTRTPHESSHV